MRRYNRFSLATYLMVFVCLGDQLSKNWAVDQLQMPGNGIVINPYLNIVYALNRGITFGILNKVDHDYVTYGLIGVAALVVVLLGRWLWLTTSRLVSVALGLIIGGAVGNVIDRVRFGAVVDFLDFHYGIHHWYAFNVADAAIVTGVSLLMLDTLVRGR